MTAALKVLVHCMPMLAESDTSRANEICAGIDALTRERDEAVAQGAHNLDLRDALGRQFDAARAEAALLRAALTAYRSARPQCECTKGSGCTMAEARAMADAALAPATEAPTKTEGAP